MSLEDELRRLHGCLHDPCNECRQVDPRYAFPACPHGDLTRPVDILCVGLNPQLQDYDTRCNQCGAIAAFRDFQAAEAQCPACTSEDVVFNIPRDYDAWRKDGAKIDPREFLSKHANLDLLEGHIGRKLNLINTRYSPWPSQGEKGISFGAEAGLHLTTLIAELQPPAILVYNQTAWRHLQRGLLRDVDVARFDFTTTGAGRRHPAELFSKEEVQSKGTKWRLSGIAVTQARDAPYAQRDGTTRRDWAAIELSRMILH